MGEAGPTRNRKSGGRAGSPRGGLRLGDHRKRGCKEEERRGRGSGKGHSAPQHRGGAGGREGLEELAGIPSEEAQ